VVHRPTILSIGLEEQRLRAEIERQRKF